jgi:hypothetical protein
MGRDDLTRADGMSRNDHVTRDGVGADNDLSRAEGTAQPMGGATDEQPVPNWDDGSHPHDPRQPKHFKH